MGVGAGRWTRNGAVRLRLGVCWLLLVWAVPGLADTPLALDDAPQSLDATVQLLEDAPRALSVDQARQAAAAGGFMPLPAQSTSLGYSRSAFWLRVVLRNPHPDARRPLLRLAYPLLDEIEVWTFEGGTLRQHWRTGDTLPFSSRPIAHRDFLFPLQLAAYGEQEILLRATSDGPINVPLQLLPEHADLPVLGGELLVLGALFGCVFLLATCVLLLYLAVRDGAFLYYLLYLISYGGYLAVFNGLAYQYVWPNSPQLASVVQVILLMSALFFLIQFSRVLLQVPQIAPRLDRANRAMQGLCLAVLLAAPFASYGSLIWPISLATLLTMGLLVAMGLTAFRAGQPTAGFYLAAWSAFLIGVFAYMFKSFGWLPHNGLTQYGFQIGTVFEFVLLSVALGIRVQELRQQSRTDALTGLSNRSRFDALIERQVAEHAGHAQPLSLLVIDVDHFKQVNDQYGHAAGDRALQQVATTLRRALPPGLEPCRYGGEEFAILLPRTELSAALALADHLRCAVASEMREPALTISVGVASARGAGLSDPRELFRAADDALYAAKRAGRNRVMPTGTAPTAPAAPAPGAPLFG